MSTTETAAKEAAPAEDRTKPAETRVLTEYEHESPLIACRFDPRGRYVFASAQDNSVLRWDLASGEKTIFLLHDSWVRAFGFTNQGETLLTAGGDGRLAWWETAAQKPEPSRVVEGHHGWIRALSVSPDASQIATGGNDLAVRLWNADGGSLVREFTGHAKHIYSVEFHPDDGNILLSGDLAGVIKQWNVEKGEETRSFDAAPLTSYNGGQRVDFGGVRTLCFSPERQHLAAGGLHEASNPLGAVHEPILLVYNWESGEKIQTLTSKPKHKGVAWRAVYHPLGGYLIAVSGGSSGGYLLFFRDAESNEFAQFKLPNIARDMDLHPDAFRVATTHYDKRLRISALGPPEVDQPA